MTLCITPAVPWCSHMNQTSLIGRPLHYLVRSVVGFAEQRGVWSTPIDSGDKELSRFFGASPTSSTGIGVSQETALNYGPVWACVKRVSDDIASTSLILYKRLKEGGKERHMDSPLYEILHDAPSEELSSYQFRRALTAHVLTWGNGYAEILRNGGGQVAGLELITPDRVTAKRRISDGRLYYEVVGGPGTAPTFVDARDMFHLAGLAYDGLVGYSVINQMRESIGLGLAAERFGGKFFGNGATFGGFFKHPGRLTEQGVKNFQQAVNMQHRGVDRAHGWMVLEENMDYVSIGIPPNDAQFLETRQFQSNEIAMWFGVPPHKIGILEESTNNNIAHQDLEYYINTLRPIFKLWEQEIRMKLIPRLERKIQFAEHLQDSRYAADIQTRYGAYSVGVTHGWLSADDVREMENMNPLPNGQGKIYLIPSNTWPADRLDEIIDKQVAPDPAPQQAPAERSDGQQIVETIQAQLVAVENRIATTTDQIAALMTTTTARTDDTAEQVRTVLAGLETKLSAAEQEAKEVRMALLLATQRADQLAAEAQARQAEIDDVKARYETDEALLVTVTLDSADAHRRADELTAERDILLASVAAETVRADQLAESHALAVEALQAATATERAEAERAVEALTALQAAATAMLETKIAALAERESDLIIAGAESVAVALELDLLRARAVRDQEAAAVTAAAEMTALRTAAEDAAAAHTAHLEAERTTQADLAKQLADAQTYLATLTAQLDAAAAKAQAEEAERTAQAQATFKAAIDAAQAADLARLAHEQRVQAEKDTEVRTATANHAARLQALIPGHREGIKDTMERLVRVDTDRARRNIGSPEKLVAWAEAFFPQQDDRYLDALRTGMRSHLVFIDSTQDVDAYMQTLIAPQLLAAVQQIRTIAAGDREDFHASMERLLTKWEQDRPLAIADAVFAEEMTYVRSL